MKSTAAQSSRKIGINSGAIFTLKKAYPSHAPNGFGDVETWQLFCLARVIESPVIAKFSR
jgi:hypothetical protein